MVKVKSDTVRKTAAIRSAKEMLLVLGILTFLGPLNIDMYLPGFPDIARTFHISAAAVQATLTSGLIGLAIGQLVIGPISDSKGRKRPLLLSITLFVFASILCAAAPTASILFAARFLQGFTAAAGLVLSRAVVRDAFDGHTLTSFFSHLMVITAVAPMIAPLIGGLILSLPGANWRSLFVFLAIFGAAASLLAALRLPETLPINLRSGSSATTYLCNVRDLLTDRSFVGYALIVAIVHGGSFAYVAGTPFVYQVVYGVSPQTFSALFSINGLAMIGGSWIVGRSKDRRQTRLLLLCAVLGTTAASLTVLIAAVFHGPLALVVSAIFVYMICIGTILTATFILAIEFQAHRAGSASALLGALPLLVGAVISPLVGPEKASATPMGIALFATSTSGLLVCCYVLAVRRAKH